MEVKYAYIVQPSKSRFVFNLRDLNCDVHISLRITINFDFEKINWLGNLATNLRPFNIKKIHQTIWDSSSFIAWRSVVGTCGIYNNFEIYGMRWNEITIFCLFVYHFSAYHVLLWYNACHDRDISIVDACELVINEAWFHWIMYQWKQPGAFCSLLSSYLIVIPMRIIPTISILHHPVSVTRGYLICPNLWPE